MPSPPRQAAQEALLLLLPRRLLALHAHHAVSEGGGDVLAVVRLDHVAHVGHLLGGGRVPSQGPGAVRLLPSAVQGQALPGNWHRGRPSLQPSPAAHAAVPKALSTTQLLTCVRTMASRKGMRSSSIVSPSFHSFFSCRAARADDDAASSLLALLPLFS